MKRKLNSLNYNAMPIKHFYHMHRANIDIFPTIYSEMILLSMTILSF